MILRNINNYKFERIKQILIVMIVLFYSGELKAQVTFSSVPLDRALVARNATTNKGQLIVAGQVDRSGTQDYDYITLRVEREGLFYASENSLSLSYVNNIASFTVSVDIEAEFANYSIEVFGVITGNTPNPISLPAGTGNEIVAGDVFVIQGQSNAEAIQRVAGDDTDEFQHDFIRVYGSAHQSNNAIIEPYHNKWYFGHGDGPNYVGGFIGQWGLKLANEIVSKKNIPVAIFNAARGNTEIEVFQKDYSDPDFPLNNNYETLMHRLDTTNLKNEVRCIFWSQGESDGFEGTTTSEYQQSFDILFSDWLVDYPSIQKVYIFQTKSGCSSSIGLNSYEEIKEAQRLIAESDTRIHLMQTAMLSYSPGDFNCHFGFTNGYEEFANRIYRLVDRDFYGGSYSEDIESPKPKSAYLVSPGLLEIQTDALSLSLNNGPVEIPDFELNGGSGNITLISVDGNKIVINYSGSINSNTTITFKGLASGENKTNFIVNSETLELVCFDEFPIDTSLLTIWDGSKWTPRSPTSSMNARMDADYDMSQGNIVSKDLEISSGVNMNFDSNSSGNFSIEVNGGLILNGNLTIGDTESFILKSNSPGMVTGSGNFFKKERTTTLNNMYDVTYWSAPVSGETLASVFSKVDPDRIFYYDSKVDNQLYTGSYAKYRHWFIASGSMEVGRGYSVDGDLTGDYSNPNYQMEVSFNGTPNYEDISVSIGAHHSNPDDDVDKVNLLGNPYPSAIDPDELILENSGNFEGALYLWGHQKEYIGGEYDPADYFSYNLSGASNPVVEDNYKIASGQGFMIMTKSSTANFEFKNDMMVANKNTDFYKVPRKLNDELTHSGKLWLKLEDKQSTSKTLLVALSNQGSDDFDVGLDAQMFKGNSEFYFYSILNDFKLSIQNINMEEFSEALSLGYSSPEVGLYKLSIVRKDGVFEKFSVFLEDTYLELTHDLKKKEYTFESDKGEFTDRFIVKYKLENIDSQDLVNPYDFQIRAIEDGFRINSEKEIRQIKAFDILGRLIHQSHPNDNEAELKINQKRKGSVILIQAIFSNNKQFVRKAILI